MAGMNLSNNYNINQLPLHVDTWKGLPTISFDRWWKSMHTALSTMIEQGYTLGQCADGVDPGGPNWVGPAPNAATMAQHITRATRTVNAIILKINPESDAYIEITAPGNPFSQDPHLLKNHLMTEYLLPMSPEELKRCKRNVEEFKMSSPEFSRIAQRLPEPRDQVLEFYSQLIIRNDKLPVANQKTEAELTTIFLNGMHSALFDQAQAELSRPSPNLAHPAVIPAGYPNAGNAHPNAGSPDIRKVRRHFHAQFLAKVDANLITLQRNVNAVEEFEGDHDANQVDFNRQRQIIDPCKPPYVKCIRCGGLFHFASVCGAVRANVPEGVIHKISYGDIPIRPLISKGKGKGGKGKGKPGGRGTLGRLGGRGGPSRANLVENEYEDYYNQYDEYGNFIHSDEAGYNEEDYYEQDAQEESANVAHESPHTTPTMMQNMQQTFHTLWN
jgi:hypothetical protein